MRGERCKKCGEEETADRVEDMTEMRRQDLRWNQWSCWTLLVITSPPRPTLLHSYLSRQVVHRLISLPVHPDRKHNNVKWLP